jgi:hypothetical protein
MNEAGMTIGSTAQLAAMIAEDSSCTLAAENNDFYFTNDLAGWEAKAALVGTGQCVALVQPATGVPLTSLWRKGPKVKGSTKIPQGTAIATFDDQGRYPNHSSGNHAALFVSVGTDGIVVVDQWAAKTPARPSRRTLKFRGGAGSPSNDGDQFWVIVTSKIQNHPDRQGGA